MTNECSKDVVSNNKKDESEFANTIKHKIDKLRDIITVEPLVGFYQLAIFLSKPALDNLEFEKACRVNLGYNDTVCSAVLGGKHRNFSAENNNVQVKISEMHTWQQPVQTFVPLLLILFLGSFSDRHKWRKPFFTIPLLGDLLGHLGCILCVVKMTSWSLEVQGIFQKIVPISSIETRTFRIGVTVIVISVTVFLANLISGILLTKFGYEGVLVLSSLLLMLSFIYGVFWIKETRIVNKEENFSIIRDVFNPKHAVDTFRIIFKKSTDNTHLYAMLLLVTLYRAANDGDNSLFYLYVQNVFQWTVVEYTYYLTANSLTTLIGNVLGFCLFIKILGTGDLIILFVTVFTRVISNVIYGCATSSFVLYIANFAGILSKLYRTAKRSYATKIVPKEDIGKTQSLLSIAETLFPGLSTPIYNVIYIHTLNTFPATTIFLSSGVYVICCCIILWMYYKMRKLFKRDLENLEGQGQYKKSDCEIVQN